MTTLVQKLDSPMGASPQENIMENVFTQQEEHMDRTDNSTRQSFNTTPQNEPWSSPTLHSGLERGHFTGGGQGRHMHDHRGKSTHVLRYIHVHSSLHEAAMREAAANGTPAKRCRVLTFTNPVAVMRQQQWNSSRTSQSTPPKGLSAGSCGEPLERMRDFWTHNLIAVLRFEGLVPTDRVVDLTPNTPIEPYTLSSSVVRLLELEPLLYSMAPLGTPLERMVPHSETQNPDDSMNPQKNRYPVTATAVLPTPSSCWKSSQHDTASSGVATSSVGFRSTTITTTKEMATSPVQYPSSNLHSLCNQEQPRSTEGTHRPSTCDIPSNGTHLSVQAIPQEQQQPNMHTAAKTASLPSEASYSAYTNEMLLTTDHRTGGCTTCTAQLYPGISGSFLSASAVTRPTSLNAAVEKLNISGVV